MITPRQTATAGLLSLAFSLPTHAVTLDLNAGDFLGQPDFWILQTVTLIKSPLTTLSPDLTLNLNDGSILGPLYEANDFDAINGFDFYNTTININDGGEFFSYFNFSGQTQSTVANAQINLKPGGILGNHFTLEQGSTLNMTGGSVYGFLTARNTDINVSAGGVGGSFTADDGAIVHITGGTFGEVFYANPGSTITIAGGSIGQNFSARNNSNTTMTAGAIGEYSNLESGSNFAISGGALGVGFSARTGSSLNLTGGEFKLNGQPVASLPANGLQPGDTLTGTLADGTPFVLADGSDDIQPGTTTLQTTSLPAIDTTPINLSTGLPNTPGLRAGQTLNLSGNATLPANFTANDATLNVTGGSIQRGFEAAGSTINMSGGAVTGYSNIANGVNLHHGTVMNLSGGEVYGGLRALGGSTLNITGGNIDNLYAFEQSSVNIHGGEFFLDGQPITQLPAQGLSFGDYFLAVLPDGSIINRQSISLLEQGTTTLIPASIPPVDPAPIIIDSGIGPKAARPGQTLNFSNNASTPDGFIAVQATINLDSGLIGRNAAAFDSEINLNAGGLSQHFTAFPGTTITINGGTISDNFTTHAHTTLNTGYIGNRMTAEDGSTTIINDGSLGNEATLKNGATLIINGGMTGSSLIAEAGSDVEIHGGLIGHFANYGNLLLTAPRLSSGFSTHPGSTTIIDGTNLEGAIGARGGRLTMLSGSLGRGLSATSGVEITILDGEFGNTMRLFTGTTLTLAGGTFSGGINALTVNSGATLNLFVNDLNIDNVDIPLTPGLPLLITQRNVPLIATLADGSTLNLSLKPLPFGDDVVYPDANLYAILALPGDANADNLVDLNDLSTLATHFGDTNAKRHQGDFNNDNIVDLIDLSILATNFNTGTGLPIPTPASATLLTLLTPALRRRRRR
ncbi:MAG: hypothetical protein RLN76_04515 [Phycisphaeraceae bacterium]